MSKFDMLRIGRENSWGEFQNKSKPFKQRETRIGFQVREQKVP